MVVTERKIAKDAWRVNIPAEYMIQAGLEKGGTVKIGYDTKTKKITLWKKEDQKVEVHDDANKVKSIIDKMDSARQALDKAVDEKIELDIKKAKDPDKVKKCSRCGRPMSDRNHLKINGKEICEDCKASEVALFKLRLHQGKIDFESEV